MLFIVISLIIIIKEKGEFNKHTKALIEQIKLDEKKVIKVLNNKMSNLVEIN